MTRQQFLSVLGFAAVFAGGCSPKSYSNKASTPADATTLQVGFLPVTCHLTCPVTDFATRTSTTFRFEAHKFMDFPSVANAFKSGRLEATFMNAPLALKLCEQGFPCHIIYLGHRDGSTIIVRKEDPARRLQDLKGKTFALPSHFSNQFLVLNKLMEKEGMAPTDINFVEVPPPQMPAALAAGKIDAYFVGEPHAAKAEVSGIGRILFKSRDIWPDFISCVLVVSDKLIAQRPQIVRDLVRGIAESGEWAERHRTDAARVAAPYYKQDEKLIAYVLNDPGRVGYRKLTPGAREMQEIHDMALKTGMIKAPIPIERFLDPQFIPTDIKPAKIDLADAGK